MFDVILLFSAHSVNAKSMYVVIFYVPEGGHAEQAFTASCTAWAIRTIWSLSR
jgi:hypothetical protein